MTTIDPWLEKAEQAGVLVPPGKMTEEEFEAWCDEDTRAEWVDGEVVLMAPPNTEHSNLVIWVCSVLQIFVEQCELGQIFADFQIRLPTERRRRTPDVVFVAKDRLNIVRRTYINGPPDLIVEIVSPDSLTRDWREKYLEYAAAGVREYWVIDPMAEHMEAYSLVEVLPTSQEPARRTYRRIEEKEGIVASRVLDGFWVPTDRLWSSTRPKVIDAARQRGLLG
jgi:Uma2 family endonuclease